MVPSASSAWKVVAAKQIMLTAPTVKTIWRMKLVAAVRFARNPVVGSSAVEHTKAPIYGESVRRPLCPGRPIRRQDTGEAMQR